MKTITNGKLHTRAMLNLKRLGDETYKNPIIFSQGGDWAGDWQGRTILALCSLYKTFEGYEKAQKDIKVQLDDIINHLEVNTNEFMYFGDKFNYEFVNEQQVSGNGWYIRGLCEYYNLFDDKRVLKYIQTIQDNFVLPIGSFYDHYPKENREIGNVSGELSGKIYNGWLISTDVGCAFIMLDGMTHMYEVTRNENLKELIINIIDSFSQVDIVMNYYQTHATLTCTRAILRFHRLTNDKYFLDLAIRIFNTYINEGMTRDYSNINWFGRPDTWTEPCAIVDSYDVAITLFKLTKELKYLQLSNRIYHNALVASQRSNGGAGPNTCLVGEERQLKVHLYEAFFCCTMRFSEGIYYLSNNQYIVDGHQILLPFINESVSTMYDGKLNMKISKSRNDESYRFIVEDLTNNNIELKIYVPKNCDLFIDDERVDVKDNFAVIKNLKNKTFKLYFNNNVYKENVKGEELLFLGDTILTHKQNVEINHNSQKNYMKNDLNYTPIVGGVELGDKEKEEKLIQIV